MSQDENNISGAFYIGWMSTAPKLFSRFIRKYLLIILPLIILLAGILALSQKKFGTGNFEFGQLTEVTGIYFSQPVPLYQSDQRKRYLGEPFLFNYTAGGLWETWCCRHDG